MPEVPAITANPYPSIEKVMNKARARVNDMINDAAGDLLADDIPASQTYLDSGWDWLQRQCATNGIETFKREIFLQGIPARVSQDPKDQAWITWGGCSDGVNQYQQPCLPQDMILPLTLGRRQSGTNSMFFDMEQATDGLPRWFDCDVWDWRADGIYFYPGTQAQDFYMRYSAYRPPLVITRPDTTVPIMMCDDCLSWRIAFEFANARGSDQAPQLEQKSIDAFNTIKTASTQRKQRQNIRRKPYNRRGSRLGYPVR